LYLEIKIPTMNVRENPFLVLSFAFLVFSLSSCGSAKEPLSSETWERLENVVTSKSFRFDARWAEPIGSRVSRVSITGFMLMQGDDLQFDLPYIGQRQVAQMGGGSQGMKFEGTATDVKTSRNEKRNYYNMDFKTRNQGEALQCNLQVFSGKKAVLTINSSQRNSIVYEGELIPVE